MTTYKVTIDFKRGPAFSTEVTATKQTDAMRIALNTARNCDFKELVKMVKARALEVA